MTITHEELETLVSIVEEGSFRAASEKLMKAQSAVSYAIKNLETDLGVTLFDRTFYRPKLTAEGETIYQKALQILNLTSELQSLSKTFSDGIEPKIRLAADLIAPSEEIITALKSFTDEFPDTYVDLCFDYSDSLIDKLNSETADIVICSKSSSKVQFKSEVIKAINFYPVAAASHPLLKRKSKLEDIDAHNLILVDNVQDGLKASIYESSKKWIVKDFQTKKQMILNVLGWGYLPEYAIKEELASGDIKKIKQLDTVKENIYLVYPKVKADGKALKFLRTKLLGQ